MARKIADIRQYLIDTLVAKAAAIGITITPSLWSRYDYKSLILDTIATGQGILEQLWDKYKSDVNETISKAAPETNQWIQDQIKNKFQFDSATPQLVQVASPDFDVKYSTTNDSLKIIKYCSVKSGIYGTTLIKAAAQVGGLPADVDTTYGAGTLDTLRAFVRSITNPSITKIVTSGSADRLWLQLDVYYNGLYAAVIQTKVTDAINSFLTKLPFDGKFLITDLEVVIKGIEGVTDCIIVSARGRKDATAFPGGNDLIINTAVSNRLYNADAGYIVLEDSVGNTLTDPRPLTPTINNLNLIAQ